MDKKISVIVPVYKVEKYLDKCVESIVNQTYKDLEIILVDDGSPDNCPEMCDQWAKIDNRIKVIHQNNGGVSNARNIGMESATGDFIAFVDSDDTIDSDMYEFLLDLMIENDADIAHCGYKHIYKDETKLINNTKKIVIQDRTESLKCLVGGYLFGGGLWNKLIKKELVASIRFPENIKINEDVLFCFNVFIKSNKSVFADYPKYNYMAHESSTTEIKKQEKSYEDRCFVNKQMYECLLSTELCNSAGSRYVSSLIDYYRFCAKTNKKKAKEVKDIIFSVFDIISCKRRSLRFSVRLLKFSPLVYRVVYSIYNKFRKPDWDIPLSN